MGQKKGNPIPSYQNQGYEQLYPNKDRSHERTNMVSNVQLDIDTNIEQYISDRLKANLPITSSGIIVNGSVRAEEYIVNIFSSSILYSSGSTIFGDTDEDTHQFTGSVLITGQSEFGGNLVPKTARGATLGTNERPFREIYVQSGSINIASDVIGDPNTTLSNVGGNILVSAGGMRLVEPGNSFIAETGSFQYISGSLTQVGSYKRFGNTILVGNQETTGSLIVSGSTIQIGNNTLTGNTQLSGSVSISGSLYMNGNKQFNYGQFCDTTTQSGSANTAYPMKLNTTDVSNGVSVVNGTQITVDNTGIYNLQFSAQFQETVNAAAEISVWLRKGGVNVINSNTELTIEKVAGGGKLVAAWNYMIQLNATEYVELVWSSDKSTTQLHYHTTQTNPTRPVTPSIIATLTQIA
jgi:hypothetical protein